MSHTHPNITDKNTAGPWAKSGLKVLPVARLGQIGTGGHKTQGISGVGGLRLRRARGDISQIALSITEKSLDPESAEKHDGETCLRSPAVWVLERLGCSCVIDTQLHSCAALPEVSEYVKKWCLALGRLSASSPEELRSAKLGVYSTSCGVKDDILCISAWPWSSWLTSLSLFPHL